MINRVIKIGLSASLLITSLYSASFDCKKASTFIENTICNDAELSKLDEELASAYKKVFHSLSDKTDLKKDQLGWLKNSRNKCMSLECLKTNYTNRVLYLTNYDNRDSQINTITSNDILGLYKKGTASIKVNQGLSFDYYSINELNGNMCYIENEKLKLENSNLVWNSPKSDCKISLSKVNKDDSIKFISSGNECNFHCGNNAHIIDGIYKKESNSVNQNQSTQQPVSAKTLVKLPQVEIYDVSPKGKLADMYNFGSKNTDIQRENMEKELKGKIVRWQLPVYEVSKITNNKYIIYTGNGKLFGESYVSTSIEITAKNNKEVEYIESLMTDDMIKIQGKITGVSLRSIDIEQASFY